MPSPTAIIKEWLEAATPAEAKQLAKRAKTSVPHLRHIAKGRRGIHPDLAQRLSHASIGMNAGLRLSQTELCAICARCPLVTAKRK